MIDWNNFLNQSSDIFINPNKHDNKLKLGPLEIQLRTLFGTPGLSLDNCVSQF